MAKIKVYPHPDMCPDGAVIEGKAGDTICEALLDNIMSDNNELISMGWTPKFNYIDGLSNIIDSLKGG